MFPERKSATVRNILMVLGRVREQLNADCTCKNDNSAYLSSPDPYLIMSPDPFLITSPEEARRITEGQIKSEGKDTTLRFH